MKKLLSLILSITLLTSMFVFTIPASAFLNPTGATTVLDGLPEGEALSFTENGFTASITVASPATTSKDENGNITITAPGDEYCAVDIDKILTYNDIQNAAYDVLEYEFSVSYKGAPKNSSTRIQLYDVGVKNKLVEGYVHASSAAYTTTDGTITMDTTGERVDKILIRVDIKKGILNGYVNGHPFVNLLNKKFSLENGIHKMRFMWYGNNSSLVVRNFSAKTAKAEYSKNKVLISGMDKFLDAGHLNTVQTYIYPELTHANKATVTDGENGAKIFSTFKQSQRFYFRHYGNVKTYPGAAAPADGKVYYQYTMSFSAVPSVLKFVICSTDNTSGTTLNNILDTTNAKWKTGDGTYQYSNFAVNTPYNIGLLYDLKTGLCEVYVNGVRAYSCSCTITGALTNLWYEVDFSDRNNSTITVSDLLVMGIEPGTFDTNTGDYVADEDAKLKGISSVPNCFKWYENGIKFEATVSNAGGSIEMSKGADNYITVTNAEPNDPESASLPYTRMIFWNNVNKTNYSSGIVAYKWNFAINGENGIAQEIVLESRNGGSTNTMTLFKKQLLPGDHEIEFIYNPANYQYRYYIDGAAGEVGVLPSEKLTNENLPDLFIQWKSKVKTNAFILKDVKFSHIDDFAEVPLSFGDVTISEENIASFPVTAPKYSLVNPAEMRFIISAYSNEGTRLTAINCETKPIYGGENTVTLSLDDVKDATVVKAFLWNDLMPIALGVK